MNYGMVRHIIGRVLGIEGAFLLLPTVTALIYRENKMLLVYIGVVLLCEALAFLLSRKKLEKTRFYAREGFVTVALCWVVLAALGALPFVLSGEIPSYVDALFETVSGFTTTGATILSDVEALSRASILWRSLTHWVGGMGVLVFMLAIVPLAGGNTIYLMRAESPGPSVNKLSPHMKDTATILYKIYFGLTVAQIVFLLLGGMPFFDAVNTSMATAGTGGFGIWNDSIAHYNSYYLQAVISVFMILFGINFSVYFLILSRKFRQALHIEEVWLYLGIILASTVIIGIDVRRMFPNLFESLHHALFQVASIITTTGFSTADFDQWPALSKSIIVLLMFIGACAGSTGGGMKCSRMLLMAKAVKKEMQYLIHPRSVRVHRMDGHRVPHEVMRSTNVFSFAYVVLFIISVIALCVTNQDLVTNFTAVAATLNNVGPGLALVGPTCNFGFFTPFSKLILMFDMLAGRLELFPMLLLLAPGTWKSD